ncbi:MAG: S8 family serine peptidase, partial [Myxococcales bacterium]|nr:S8 family serine peptidase [Myxococcales bacterium]
MLRRSLLALALTLAAAPAGAAPDIIRDMTPLDAFVRNVAQGGRYLPGEVLVTARSVDHRGQVVRAAEAKGCRLVRPFGRRPLYLFECPKAIEMTSLIQHLQDTDGVRWVEASYYEDEEATRPDDLDARQWYHENTGQTLDNVAGTEGADIGSLDAWDFSVGDRRRVILINDVGVYTQHQDLKDQIWTNEDEDCTNGVDDDGNGYVDDCHGFDFGDDDNDPDPSSLPETKSDGSDCLRWHATMIAGLAGAQGNNGVGIVGVNWNVSFMNVKKHRDSTCVSTTTRSIEAVLYAVDNGADVISMSFSDSDYNATFEQALQEAERQGLINVSSGGNGGRDDDTLSRYPNQYDVTNKLVVANSNNRDRLDSSSNYGATTVDMVAPGTYVMSTSLEGPTTYSIGTGSSYSAGFAAGAVTLTWAAFPMLTATEVLTAIKDGAQHLDNLDCTLAARCVKLGSRIDTHGAMLKAAELAPANLGLVELYFEEVGDGDGVLEAGETAFLRPAVHNDGRGPAFAVGAALVAPDGGLSVDRSGAALGDLQPGETNDTAELAEPWVVSVPSDCKQAFTANLEMTFTDRLGRTFSGTGTLDVTCQDPGAEPGG